MKFGTSFVLTRRKVRELHPVSRHVRTTGVTASSWGCPLFSKVSGKLEAGERRVRCAVERGSPSHTQSRLHAGWGASVIDFLSALLPECVCVCVCWLCASTAGEPPPAAAAAAGSVHSHLPSAPLKPLWSVRDAPERGEALSLLPH